MQSANVWGGIVAMGLVLAMAGCASNRPAPGTPLTRSGDEIVVAGQFFHTGAPVVLWMDPGGYDAYRTEKRFGPIEDAAWSPQSGPDSPARYNTRSRGLTDEQLEEVRGGGWPLELLQDKVDQFVLHYDVCGTSRQCFKVLQDARGLSVHFMLDIDGTIYQTLDLKERAWHATKSNHRSIGIEIANIGAYPVEEAGMKVNADGKEVPGVLAQWYQPDATGRPRITLPAWMGDGGVRTKGFVGYPARIGPDGGPIVGMVQGQRLAQYDLTPQQYDSLIKLTAALCTIFPKIECDYPRDEQGRLKTTVLTDEEWENFHGVMGHWHVQRNKTDPGPALQWDYLMQEARKLMR